MKRKCCSRSGRLKPTLSHQPSVLKWKRVARPQLLDYALRSHPSDLLDTASCMHKTLRAWCPRRRRGRDHTYEQFRTCNFRVPLHNVLDNPFPATEKSNLSAILGSSSFLQVQSRGTVRLPTRSSQVERQISADASSSCRWNEHPSLK